MGELGIVDSAMADAGRPRFHLRLEHHTLDTADDSRTELVWIEHVGAQPSCVQVENEIAPTRIDVEDPPRKPRHMHRRSMF